MTDRAGELFDTMRTVASIGITWWAAGLLACASLMAGAWARRDEIRRTRPLAQNGLFALVGFFLLTVVGFGLLMIWSSKGLGGDLQAACGARPAVSRCGREASIMTSGMVWGFSIGTTSFIGCLIAWVVAWREIQASGATVASQATD